MGSPRSRRRGLLVCLALLLSVSSAFGTAQLELVSITGAGCNVNPIAKCFNSIIVSWDGTDVTVAPTDPGDSSAILVPALWTGGLAYSDLTTCPAAGDADMTGVSGGSLAAALNNVFSASIWATPLTTLTTTLTTNGFTVVDSQNSCTLVWKASSSDVAGITAVPSGTPTCTAGSYLVTPHFCALCRAGSYSAGTGATSCTTVAAGRASSAVGATADGAACPAGTYAESAGTSDCVPCPPGTFAAAGGAGTTCYPCPSGSYSYVEGAAVCVRCQNGRAVTCTDSASCSAAFVGSASAGYAVATLPAASFTSYPASPPMLSSCASTTLSFFVRATCEVVISTLGDSTATPNGLQCATPGNDNYTVSGYYTTDTTIMAVLSDVSGSSIKVDYASSTLTMSVSTATTDPNNQAPTAAATAVLTVTGGKIATTGTEHCPAGTTISGSSAKSCTPCPAGQYCSGTDSATSSDCAAGTASPILGATSACANCAVGTYSAAAATTCISCPIGTYNPTAGLATCASCPGANSVGQSTCDNSCSLKQFRNPATGNCENCPAGYGVHLVSNVPTCTLCPAGQESPANSAVCTDCVAGTYAADEGTANCATCPAGTSGGKAATSCTACSAGQEAVAGSTTCTDCATGFYRNGSGSDANAACFQCPDGYFTDLNSAATTCTKCPAGTYAVWTSGTRFPADSTVCQPCAAGTANARKGQKVCIDCPGGQYTVQNNAVAGSDAVNNHGATACSACTAGMWRPPFSPSTLGCQDCAAGSETTVDTGATACTACPANSYAATAATTACSDCEVNHSTSGNEGATACDPCAAGSDTSGFTGSDCSPCAPGTVNPTAGQSCTACNSGYCQDAEGQTACNKCAVGFYSNSVGAEACLSCPAGKYANVKGSTSCKTCPAGTSSVGGAGSCTVCSAGFYAAAGSFSCTPCPVGYFAAKRGTSACTKCPPGSFCDTVGLAAAKACPAGQFSSASAQKKCKLCPPNTYAAGTGSAACRRCAVGTYANKITGGTGCVSVNARRRAVLADGDTFQLVA